MSLTVELADGRVVPALAYYNEFDTNAADWLENLIRAGLIAPGIVDRRSLLEVTPADLEGFVQCHFFAGIGIWSYGLRAAGWADDRPIWTGSCPCFPAGTLILTGRGLLPIEQVTVGDMVLTHKGRWRAVTHIGTKFAPTIRLKGQGVSELITTADHPIFTEDFSWQRATDMKGLRWRTVRKVEGLPVPHIENNRGVSFVANGWRATGWKNGKSRYLGRFADREQAIDCRKSALIAGTIDVRGADACDPMEPGFARFLGYWLGDGWTSRDTVFLCGAISDVELVSGIFKDAGMQASMSIERTSSRGRVGSKALVNWLNANFGTGAQNKTLPAWIFGMPRQWLEAFIDGYHLADGHLANSGRVWTTTSKAIAIGLRILLNRSGISASIGWRKPTREKCEIEGRVVNERGFYRVQEFTKPRSFRFDDEHGLGLVRSVEDHEIMQVFNLAVEEDETYTADGIVVHNCQPFSAAGKQKGFNDERHLWPVWFENLIDQCRPAVVVGEQVASALDWIDSVSADLEGAGYAVGAVDICAAGFAVEDWRETGPTEWLRRAIHDCPDPMVAGQLRDFAAWADENLGGHDGDHIRQRMYFVGIRGDDERGDAGLDNPASEFDHWSGQSGSRGWFEYPDRSDVGGMVNFDDARLEGHRRHGGLDAAPGRQDAPRYVRQVELVDRLADHLGDERRQVGSDAGRSGSGSGTEGLGERPGDGCACDRLADGNGGHTRTKRQFGSGEYRCEPPSGGSLRSGDRRIGDNTDTEPSGTDAPDRRRNPVDWLFCRDGKWRPVESGTFPLVDADSGRVGRLRAYGNALDGETVTTFCTVVREICDSPETCVVPDADSMIDDLLGGVV